MKHQYIKPEVELIELILESKLPILMSSLGDYNEGDEGDEWGE